MKLRPLIKLTSAASLVGGLGAALVWIDYPGARWITVGAFAVALFCSLMALRRVW